MVALVLGGTIFVAGSIVYFPIMANYDFGKDEDINGGSNLENIDDTII